MLLNTKINTNLTIQTCQFRPKNILSTCKGINRIFINLGQNGCQQVRFISFDQKEGRNHPKSNHNVTRFGTLYLFIEQSFDNSTFHKHCSGHNQKIIPPKCLPILVIKSAQKSKGDACETEGSTDVKEVIKHAKDAIQAVTKIIDIKRKSEVARYTIKLFFT